MTDNREKLIEAIERGIYGALSEPVSSQDFTRQMRQWARSQELAHAALSAIEAMGAVVVPVEATDEMSEAGWVRLCDHTHLTAEDIYTVMLAASPYAKETT
jgi:hypothetical protein